MNRHHAKYSRTRNWLPFEALFRLVIHHEQVALGGTGHGSLVPAKYRRHDITLVSWLVHGLLHRLSLRAQQRNELLEPFITQSERAESLCAGRCRAEEGAGKHHRHRQRDHSIGRHLRVFLVFDQATLGAVNDGGKQGVGLARDHGPKAGPAPNIAPKSPRVQVGDHPTSTRYKRLSRTIWQIEGVGHG